MKHMLWNSGYLPPGCTQDEIDRQLEDPEGPRLCDECGERLEEGLGGWWECPVCDAEDWLDKYDREHDQ